MPRNPTYLTRDRHGQFHFRARIPKPLRQHFDGKAEIKRSLKTDSRREAIKRARALRVELDKQMDELLHLVKMRRQKFKLDEAKDELWDLKVEKHKQEIRHQKELSEAKEDADHHKKVVARLATAAPTPTGPLLSVTVAEYIEDKIALGCWKPRSASQVETTLRDFLLIVGDQPITSVTKKTIADYRQKLARLPANRGKLKQYRDKTIAEILALPEVTPMDLATVKNNLGRVSPFFQWCVEREYLTKSPAEAITKPLPKGKKAKGKRDTFTREELQALFHSEEYEAFKEPYRYWVPIIGLYSGARLEEICKLKLSDIQQREGVWCFAIEDAKTLAGWREVPLHRKLIELGLLDYISDLKRAGKPRLFPELEGKRDGYGDTASKWFARYRKSLGVGASDGKKCFHSLRHTFKDWLQKKCGVDTPYIKALIGHEPGDVTDGTYGNEFTAEDLKPHIDKLDYGLNHPQFALVSA